MRRIDPRDRSHKIHCQWQWHILCSHLELWNFQRVTLSLKRATTNTIFSIHSSYHLNVIDRFKINDHVRFYLLSCGVPILMTMHIGSIVIPFVTNVFGLLIWLGLASTGLPSAKFWPETTYLEQRATATARVSLIAQLYKANGIILS